MSTIEDLALRWSFKVFIFMGELLSRVPCSSSSSSTSSSSPHHAALSLLLLSHAAAAALHRKKYTALWDVTANHLTGQGFGSWTLNGG